MADKRNHNRRRKRIPLRYGIDGPIKVAFTDDITREGLFIRTALVAPPGAKLHIELVLPTGKVACLAEVRWIRKIPPQMLNKLKGGMGVKFISFQAGADVYQQLCDQLYGAPP